MRTLSIGLILCALGVTFYNAVVIGRALLRGSEVAAESRRFSARPDSHQKTMLVVGDSTAVGTGVIDPAQSIAGRISTEFPATRIDNLGVNGALTRAVPAQLVQAPLAQYDVVLIQVGGNDVLRFTGMRRLSEDIEKALAAASGLTTQIALMSTGNVGDAPALPWPVDEVFSWRSRLVRDLFAEAAERHGAHYVDLFVEPPSENPFLTAPKKYHSRDGLHPSGAGYGAWYKKLRAQVPLSDWLVTR